MKTRFLFIFLAAWTSLAQSQMRPPAFMGGIPGKAQFQAIQMQRHQARTLLYREALDELRKNPTAADVPDCPPNNIPAGSLCLRRPASTAPEPTPAPQPPKVITTAEAPPQLSKAPAPPPQVPAKASPVEPVTPKPVPAVVAAPAKAPPAAPLPVVVEAPPAKVAPTEPPPVAIAPAPAKPKPVEAAQVEAKPAAPAPREGRRYAVLMGNNDYKMPIPELETPISDVSKTAEVLKARFGFETRVLKNASKTQIVEAFNRLADETTPEDSVLLFYAGHGYLMDDTKMGFWIPIDASVKTAANWISNTDISKLLSAIRARQLILVSDSCFSGSLTREQKVTSSGKPKPEEILRRRSVLVLSSGGDEPVSDEGKDGHSIFAWNLIKTLDTASGTTPGYEVWRTVHGGVSKEYSQEPQYGAVVSAGHNEGGEYLFQPR